MSGAPFSEPLAVLSCIHGNLPALEAVFRDLDHLGVRDVLCLGDLVGYGPQPNEVVERLRERDIAVVQGCWDEGIGKGRNGCGCTFASREDAELGELAYTWTDLEVTAETRQYLSALPPLLGRSCVAGRVAFAHGSPASNAEYLQTTTHELVLLERASRVDCDILMVGHTHVPFVKRVSGMLAVREGEDPDAEPKRVTMRETVIVNAGSVGEPRHGGPEATYVLLDQTTGKLTIRAVPYDVVATQRSLERAGLPPCFGERLAGGREILRKRKDILCAC